ncbi:S1C family serine protease [Patescibacteria group bacterium]|nr:S1C family serine protease [Patescibacteria group bacterium]
MDIETLNKSQTILLTLLVSFVTSIATGIVTVTLMDQAPPAMTQTIHRVVEKTVETVTPKEQTASVSQVVVVREESKIADVVAKNENSFVRIYQNGIFSGLGIFVDKRGILVTDRANILEDLDYAVSVGGKIMDVSILGVDSGKRIAYLKIVDEGGIIFKSVFDTVSIADADSLKLGQSIIVLGGVESTEVLTGIVSGLVRDNGLSDLETASTTTEKIDEKEIFVSSIKTNIPVSGIIGGSPLLNLKGDVVGININPGDNSFIPINFIKEDLKTILNLVTE